MTIPYDMLGLISGLLGILGLVPLLWALVHYQLPEYKLRQLDTALTETTTLLDAAIQDGFVPSASFVRVMQDRLFQ